MADEDELYPDRLEVDCALDDDYESMIKKREAQGWRLVGAEPIEEIKVIIIGRRFKFKWDTDR